MDAETLKKLCEEQNRNEESEFAAFKAGQDYYFVPGVAEQHEQELTKLQNDILRNECSQIGMDKYFQQAKDLITKWSLECNLNPEEEIALLLKSNRNIWGERIWLRKRVRALWW